MVGGIGFEPMASSVSTKRSPPDLTAHIIYVLYSKFIIYVKRFRREALQRASVELFGMCY